MRLLRRWRVSHRIAIVSQGDYEAIETPSNPGQEGCSSWAIAIGILGAAGVAPAVVLRPARRRDDVVIGAVASVRDARG
jgi:hypothetical protein